MPFEKPVEECLSVGPIEMVVLQGTPFCNLNCSYCYLSEGSRRNKTHMDVSAISTIFRRLLASRYVDKALRVSWHSGEPLVLKPSYYREAIETILAVGAEVSPDCDISFDIQTNGTLISQEWCDLLTAYGDRFFIGVSCDGPAMLHDRHRRNWSGKPTHHLTHDGMRRLCDHGIDFDVTAVVSPESLDYPREFLEYFSQFTDHIREFHFNLHDEFFIDSDKDSRIDEYARRYQVFLRALLSEIAANDEAKFPSIRNFSSFYNLLFVKESDRPQYDARSMSRPFKTLSIETTGDVTTFYAGLTVDECRDLKDLYGDGKGLVIGNIFEDPIDGIASSAKLQRVADDFERSHHACERECDYYGLCSGGYSLIKYRRFGTFDATQTPECLVHVKAFADTMLNDINQTGAS